MAGTPGFLLGTVRKSLSFQISRPSGRLFSGTKERFSMAAILLRTDGHWKSMVPHTKVLWRVALDAGLSRVCGATVASSTVALVSSIAALVNSADVVIARDICSITKTSLTKYCGDLFCRAVQEKLNLFLILP